MLMEDEEIVEFAHDHADNTVAELIGSRNYKQALKNLDKRKKKGSQLNAQIVKAAILCRSGDHAGSAKLVTELLVSHAPPYAPDACQLLYSTLCDVRNGGIEVKDKVIEDVWVKTIAAEARQDDKRQLAKDWMSLAIYRRHWNFVVKASQLLSTSSAGDEKAILQQWTLQICARYLQHMSSSSGSELDRRLAVQTLQKAAKNTPEPSALAGPSGKWIATDKQLKLLAEVYIREGQHHQLLDLLNMDKFQQQMLDGNTDFRSRKASLWGECLPKDSSIAIEWVKKMLVDVSDGEANDWLRDDWTIWRLLTQASAISGTSQGSREYLETLVEADARHSSGPRAPALAKLDLQSHQSPAAVGNQSSKTQACHDYFLSHSQSDSVGDDLRSRILSLPAAEQKVLQQQIRQHIPDMEPDPAEDQLHETQPKWLRAAMNSLAIDRIILDDVLTHDEDAKQRDFHPPLREYIASCLSLCKIVQQLDDKQRASLANATKATIDNISWATSQAAILTGDSCLSHYAALVHLLHADVGQTDEWRIKLIHDMQLRGATLTAWPHYEKLGVQHTSIETAAPLIFSGISATIPFQLPQFDAYVELRNCTKFYTNKLRLIPQYQDMALSHENYDQCMGIHDLIHELEASPVRWIMALERRRIARLRGLSYDHEDTLHEPSLIPVPLSTKRRAIWEYASTPVSESYIDFLAYLDDFAELVKRASAPDEVFYLNRLRARRINLTPTTGQMECLRLHDHMVVVAEAVTKLDTAMTVEALRALTSYLTTRVDEEKLEQSCPAHLNGCIPVYDTTLSFSLEALNHCSKLCKKAANRMKDRKISAGTTAAEQASQKLTRAIRDMIKNRIEALKMLHEDEALVVRVLGSTRAADFRATILELVELCRAQEYLLRLIDGSILSLEALLKIGLA